MYCDKDETCSGHGNCSPSSGTCNCQGNYYTSDCSVYCHKVHTCNNNGQCDSSTGQCVCSSGYYGPSCSITCDPVQDCSNHGACNPQGQCACNQNYYSEDCSVFCDASTTCSNHGQCATSTGECQCDSHYYSQDCSVYCDASTSCNGHGQCASSTGLCQCDENYYSSDCSLFCDPVTTCNNHGTCSSSGVCECDDPWYGDHCDMQPCPNDCTPPNGQCDLSTGTCTCFGSWIPPSCAFSSCPNDCSGHGTCDSSTGQCTCDPGFGGEDCQPVGCPNNCSDHGVCNEATGVCACEVGFQELPDCSRSKLLISPFGCRSLGPGNFFTLYFGYENLNADSMVLTGTDNVFSSLPPRNPDRPTVFLPGRHENVFSETFNFQGSATWTLAQANFASLTRISGPLCPQLLSGDMSVPSGPPPQVSFVPHPVRQTSSKLLGLESVGDTSPDTSALTVETFVGFPPIPVQLLVDTSSSVVAVKSSSYNPSSSIESYVFSASHGGCASHQAFEGSDSKCAVSGEGWSGYLTSDSVSLGGPSTFANVAIMTSLEGNNLYQGVDGSLGLNLGNPENLLTQMTQSAQLSSPQLGLCVNADGSGYLHTGRVNETASGSNMAFLSLSWAINRGGDPKSYSVFLSSVLVNGRPLSSDGAVLNAGVKGTVIQSLHDSLDFPTPVYAQLLDQLMDAVPDDLRTEATRQAIMQRQAVFSASLLTSLPNVELVVAMEPAPSTASMHVNIPPAAYFRETSNGNFAFFLGQTPDSGPSATILGSPFLRDKFVLFDFQNGRIGVAPLAQPCSMDCRSKATFGDCVSHDSCGWCEGSDGQAVCVEGDDAGPTSPEFRRMCGLRTIMRSKSAVAGASHAANTWVHISRGTTVQKPDGRNPNSPKEDNGGSSKTVVIALSVSLGTLVVVVAVLATVSYFRRRRRGPARTYLAGPSIQGEEEDEGEAEDRPLFSHRGNQSSHQNYGLAVKL